MRKYLAIDIGGTNIKYGIVNDSLVIEESYSVKTPEQGIGETERQLKEIIGQFPHIDGVGFSIAAGYDQQNNQAVSISRHVSDLADIDFVALGQEFDLEVVVENDVNAFALAELHAGNAKGCSNVAVVVIGTAIGGGIIINGQLYHGNKGNAGEFGTSLLERYALSPFVGAEAGCFGLLTKVNQQTGNNFTRLEEFYNSEDSQIQSIIKQNNYQISMMISNVIGVLAPERVLIGGPVTKEEGYLEEQISNVFSIEEEYKQYCEIQRCKHTDKGALIGVVSKFTHLDSTHRKSTESSSTTEANF